VLTEKPAQPTLFYPAQGITESWTRGHADTHRAIAELMGESRARVLGALDVPRTTTETAENCGLAISTTSRHQAGVAAQRRPGDDNTPQSLRGAQPDRPRRRPPGALASLAGPV
jgi:hypothetical protein